MGNKKLKMKHCNRTFVENEKDINSSMKARYENAANNNFGEVKDLSDSNYYCKFKLKKNRKIAVPKENKNSEKMIPPMAPNSTTQYLTKIRNNSNEQQKEDDFIQIF